MGLQPSSRRCGKPFVDISGKKIARLTALYPTDRRDAKGFVIWHCRCECGRELDISYNDLRYSNRKSCGCQKEEHNRRMKDLLHHVDGTSMEALRSKKLPANNTTGVRGVYRVRDKYLAKIVFQKKAYYLGSYDRMEDAVAAREEAERALNETALRCYAKWKRLADQDPNWGRENPLCFQVKRDADNCPYLIVTPQLPANS